jgi:hypothetical protein
MTLVILGERRPLGRIILDAGTLTGTTPGAADMAASALVKAGGDAAAAYDALDGYCNGYVTIIPEPPGGMRKTRPKAAAWTEAKHPRNRLGEFTRKHGARPVTVAPITDAAEASPEEFSRRFEAAFAGSPFAAFVNHYTPAEMRAAHMTTVLAEGGKAGVAIHDHGDGRVEATAVFNTSGKPGAGLGLLRMAVDRYHVNYVECFGPVLPRLYGALGFADADVYPFDPAEEPPGWDHARFDEPDYHTMRLAEAARVAAAAGGEQIDVAALLAEAAAADPGWWAEYGDDAAAAALAVAGLAPPSGPRAAAWNPAEHPRIGHGEHGGEFARTHGGDPLDPAHGALIEAKVAAAMKAGKATSASQTLDHAGQVWSPKRAAVHNEIVNAVLAGAAGVPRDGKAILGGGLPGAGKTTALHALPGVDPGDYLAVAPDDFKEELARRGLIPKVAGLSPMEASPLVSDEAHHIANMVLARALAERMNVIIDLTMHPADQVEQRVAQLHGAGYTVRGVYVHVPLETSVERAMARYAKGAATPLGGRYVPPEDIRRIWGTGGPESRSHLEFDRVRGQFDQWDLVDNSQFGRPPAVLESGVRK